jgi:hypothetical protein
VRISEIRRPAGGRRKTTCFTKNSVLFYNRPLIWIVTINRDPVICKKDPHNFQKTPNLDRDR